MNRLRNFVRWAALALALALGFSGCAPLSFQNTNELLRAPALGQQQGEIQKALASALGEEPQYKFPKEGDWQSPLLMTDLDGDGVQECIALYSLQSNSTGNVTLALLQKQGEAWVLTQEIQSTYNDVASIEAADLLGNGTRQLIVGFATANMAAKNFALYQYDDALNLVYPLMPYSRYAMGDLTGRGSTDLVLVTPGDASGGMELIYLPASGGAFETPQQAVKLDTNFLGCIGIHPSLGPEGAHLLVIDGLYTGDQIVSQLVEFTGELFFVPEDINKPLSDSGRSNPLLISRDIDGDGVVEIPISAGEITTFKGDKRLEFVDWKDFITPEADTKQFGLLDSDRGLYIRLPDGWKNSVLVEDGAGEGEWAVKDAETRRTLLRLEVLADSETPPATAIQLPGLTSACLIPASGLPGEELRVIQVTSLI